MTWPTEQAREAVAAELVDRCIGGEDYYAQSITEAEAVDLAHAVIAALAPHVEAMLDQARAEAERQHRLDWAAYFDAWRGAKGVRELTVDRVIKALSAELPPFGVAKADERADRVGGAS